MKIPKKTNRIARFASELKKHYCSYKGDGANFVRIGGGSFKLTEKFFTDFYLPAYAQFDNDVAGSLVFKVPKEKPQPICVDLDIVVRSKDDYPSTTDYANFAGELAKNFKADVTILITNRPEVTVKKTKTKNCLRHGAHLYFIGRYSLEESQDLRKFALKNNLIKNCFEKFMVNTSEDLYDSALSDRDNGLLMIGARKPKSNYGAHAISYCNTWLKDKGWEREDGAINPNSDQFKTIFKDLYGFIWEKFKPKPKPKQPKLKLQPPKPKPSNYMFIDEDEKVSEKNVYIKPESFKVIERPDEKFQLSEFLKVSKGIIPNNKEYVQLCAYFAKVGLEPDNTCRKTNKAWNPENLNETANLMKKQSHHSVNKATIVKFLTDHDVFDIGIERRIWKLERKHRNNLERFYKNTEKSFDQFDVERDLISTYNYIHGNGNSIFVYTETSIQQFKLTTIVVTKSVRSKDVPFKDSKTDRAVMCHPTEKDYRTALSKWKKPKKLTRPREDCTTKEDDRYATAKKRYRGDLEQYELAMEFLHDGLPFAKLLKGLKPLDPIEKSLGTILQRLIFKGKIKEFHSAVSRPYLRYDDTPPDQFNCFTGFPLAKYLDDDHSHIKIKETKIWKWLNIAWANRTEYKMDYLLNYFSHKIQFPALKIMKFLIALSAETGTGKSTISKFGRALFDGKSVLQVSRMKDFVDKFNGEQAGKMLIIIEDIENWSLEDSGFLKTRITEPKFRCRLLYTEAEEMDCHMDLIATSNREAAVFIDKDDRRTEMIKINPELKIKLGDKASTQFWKDLNDEFANVEIMAAWFSFLANRDIAGIVFNEDYRFSREELQACAKNNLINSHQFMVEYFVRSDCILNNSRLRNIAPEFFSYTEFKIYKGERTMIIKAQKLYNILYKDIWCIDSGNKIRKKERTFVKDLETLGLKCRYKLHGSTQTSTCIRLSRKTLIEGLIETYTHITSHPLEGFFLDINSIWNKLAKHEFDKYSFQDPT